MSTRRRPQGESSSRNQGSGKEEKRDLIRKENLSPASAYLTVKTVEGSRTFGRGGGGVERTERGQHNEKREKIRKREEWQ